MAAAQARTDRQLHELLQRPGNGVCADCGSPAPRWCSWSLGIFLCVSCATVHRKLGSHVSRVKSLTLDTFTREQIDALARTGNTKGNAERANDERANPRPTNLEMEGRDNELERYIRRKYTGPRPLPAGTSLLQNGTRQPVVPMRPASSLSNRSAPSRSTPSPAPTPGAIPPSQTAPVFSSGGTGGPLEHRPAAPAAAAAAGGERMRRGRPTPAIKATPVGSFVPPSHATPAPPPPPPPPPPTTTGAQAPAPTHRQASYDPSMQFAAALQQQRQQRPPPAAPLAAPGVPPHGVWGGLMSLASGPAVGALPPAPAPFVPSGFQPPPFLSSSQPAFAPPPLPLLQAPSFATTGAIFPPQGMQPQQPQQQQGAFGQPTGFPLQQQGLHYGALAGGFPQPQQQQQQQAYTPSSFPQLPAYGQQQQQQPFPSPLLPLQPQQQQQQPLLASHPSFMTGMLPARTAGPPGAGAGGPGAGRAW